MSEESTSRIAASEAEEMAKKAAARLVQELQTLNEKKGSEGFDFKQEMYGADFGYICNEIEGLSEVLDAVRNMPDNSRDAGLLGLSQNRETLIVAIKTLALFRKELIEFHDEHFGRYVDYDKTHNEFVSMFMKLIAERNVIVPG